jgi:hypothetical protein
MRTTAAATVLAMALFAAPAAHAQSDPLAPARQGQVQCFEPDAANKTCAAIASYAFAADGTINNTSDVLIFPEPAIVMHITSPVTERGDQVCGPIRNEDIASAQFVIDGQPTSDDNAQTIRAQMREQLAAMIGVEVCSRFVPDGGGFRAVATAGGRPQPDQRVAWVRPSDGYRVAPPPSAAPAAN